MCVLNRFKWDYLIWKFDSLKTFEATSAYGQPNETMSIRYSPRDRNRFNQVVEAKRFEGVFLCRKVCWIQKSNSWYIYLSLYQTMISGNIINWWIFKSVTCKIYMICTSDKTRQTQTESYLLDHQKLKANLHETVPGTFHRQYKHLYFWEHLWLSSPRAYWKKLICK